MMEWAGRALIGLPELSLGDSGSTACSLKADATGRKAVKQLEA